ACFLAYLNKINLVSNGYFSIACFSAPFFGWPLLSFTLSLLILPGAILRISGVGTGISINCLFIQR
ncbi:hypothetical protein, partial [Lachnoclostridium sp. An138]|uniref:hypothetical protein n=1 Tax=Lachnoclostridium sp. An138 TaxID=1965560 RepID=UPI0019D0B097